MPRPVWTGSLSFGLVNVPVKAFTATRDHSVHFHQLEKGTGARIRNQRVSDKTGKQVDADDIEMGYELRKGRYVTFEKDELADLKPESTRAVEVTDFVALEDIDPMFYERTYWLAPADDHAKEAYQLLHAAMVERGRVGIGTVVMRNNQYLTAIRPIDKALAMSTMHFADEIVDRSDIDGLPTRRTKPSPKAMKLATQIVDALSSDWNPSSTTTPTPRSSRASSPRRTRARPTWSRSRARTEPRADVGDLMAALEASISKSGRKSSSRRSSRPATKKGTASGTPRTTSARPGPRPADRHGSCPQPSTWTCSWWAPTRTTASVAGSVPGLDHRWRVPFCTTVSPGWSVTIAPSSSSSTGVPDSTTSMSQVAVVCMPGAPGSMWSSRPGRVAFTSARAAPTSTPVGELVVAVGRQREEVEAEAADAREVARPRLHRAVVREVRRLVEAPQLVERAVRREPRHERRDHVVADEHRLAVGVVPRDHPAHVHQVPPRF